ncbi:MAG TPA: N-acetyl-alpha-D-glucosaminyl L-malate synthase BshA [Opitutaceae bacterium]|nr:N-acetyl-alpha-D-glucosaminyl L-malate synthase BshA [Opitutaceae bacterium]
MDSRPLRIGLTCHPSVGGSGILASALGEELAARGHEVHFFSYERPFRLPPDSERLRFHPVTVSNYGLFRYPDYTLPLSVKMAEVSRERGLDVLHVHYAVPHATAALLAVSMLPEGRRPRVVTTLHGTDTTLLGRDPGYGPAIRHALARSDAVTTVSAYLEGETRRLLAPERPIEVIHNFFSPRPPRRSREEVRRELGVGAEALIVHASNLRPLKRVDLLLEAAALVRPREAFRLAILAGGDFAPFAADVRRLGLEGRVIVRERVGEIEEYLQAADLGLFTSEIESFCLGVLETMCFGGAVVASAVGGIPEVLAEGAGVLVPFGQPAPYARAVEGLLADPARRAAMGAAARRRARELFSADAIVPRYEALYRRVCAGG